MGTSSHLTSSTASRIAKIGVLVADDDRRIALVVKNALESLGFKSIYLVSDGTQALTTLNSKKIDMVITDWQMTPMDGISLVRYLRTMDDSPNRFIPIIMLTGNADRNHVAIARDVGVTEFVVKPFSAKTLCDRIIALVDNPRCFILSPTFIGPDRRRRGGPPPEGSERRTR